MQTKTKTLFAPRGESKPKDTNCTTRSKGLGFPTRTSSSLLCGVEKVGEGLSRLSFSRLLLGLVATLAYIYVKEIAVTVYLSFE